MTGLTDVCYLAGLSAKRIHCVFMLYFCKSDKMESVHASVSQSVCLLFVCVCDLTNECIFLLILHLHLAQSIINPIANFLYSILMPQIPIFSACAAFRDTCIHSFKLPNVLFLNG